MMDLGMDRCPTCKGDGQIRGAWAVTHWQMVPCQRCGETGTIPALQVEDIIYDAVAAAINITGEAEVNTISREILNQLIDRGIFILRERDLMDARQDALNDFRTRLEQLHQQMAEATLADTDEERLRLAEVLRTQAHGREKLVPGSPIATDLRAAADLIDPANICPTCKSTKKDEAGNPEGLPDMDAPIHCDDSWHLS